jgi:hypothetical protein
MRQALEMLELNKQALARAIAEAATCGSPEALERAQQILNRIAGLVDQYHSARVAANRMAADWYGDGVSADDVTDLVELPPLRPEYGGPGETVEDRKGLNDRITSEREEAEDAYEIAVEIDKWNSRAGMAIGGAAIATNTVRIFVTESGRILVRRLGEEAAVVGAAAVAGYALSAGTDAACNAAGLSDKQRAWVHAAESVIAAALERRTARRHVKSSDGLKYPRNPDDWKVPHGWTETPAGAKTGGRHRQWIDGKGNIRRRWDSQGREAGKERGPHWHDYDDESGGKNHIDPED